MLVMLGVGVGEMAQILLIRRVKKGAVLKK